MKNFLFGCIIAVFTYLFIELCAFAAYKIKFGDYNLENIQQSKVAVLRNLKTAGVYSADNFGGKDVVAKQVLHPYVGYTTDGKVRNKDCESELPEDCYTRIKIDADAPLHKRAPNKLIVAILGGSFADGVGRIGEARIKQGLENSAQYKDYDIVVYNLAAGGYKQPQQLTQLAYHYALGGEYDVVINLDGFNEFTIPLTNFRDRSVHPAFPDHWNGRVASVASQEYLDLYSRKRQVRQSHANLAQFSLATGLRHSPLINFVWRFLDIHYQQRLAHISSDSDDLASQKTNKPEFQATGPDYNFSNWDDFARDIGDIWLNSSLVMRNMVEGHDGVYLHFLQPNQYIAGSKILSAWEQKNAVLEKGSYGNIYQTYFPIVQEKAAQLKDLGVKFSDLSFIFQNETRTLYIDNCCHINNPGIDIIADKIVATIIAQ